jgi:hypothetical protein
MANRLRFQTIYAANEGAEALDEPANDGYLEDVAGLLGTFGLPHANMSDIGNSDWRVVTKAWIPHRLR